MKAIFVHLSDIHFGQEKDGGTVAINNDAKMLLIDDARAEVAKLGGKASGVIVTGDIAYSGKKEEYQIAATWLAHLADAIGCERVNVQMVPGNHDIDREKISATLGCVLCAIREQGDEVLDPILDSATDCEVLYSRFEAYADFALDYDSELDLNGGISSGGRLELAEGRSILFVRLNSALICSRKDDKGKLMLGKRQRIFPTRDGEEIVVLAHHPLSWFQDSDKARNYLRNRARVLISGHEHYPRLGIDAVEDGCELMLLAAGATNPDQVGGDYTYKYNILVFEWVEESDALAATVVPRTWDEDATRFRRDDAFMEGSQERQVLASPDFRKAQRPVVASLAEGESFDRPPEVEPVIASSKLELSSQAAKGTDTAADAVEHQLFPTVDERLLQLRFFQELPENERLRALVELETVPRGFKDRLDHSMERRLFRMLLKQGKGQAIEQRLASANAKNAETHNARNGQICQDFLGGADGCGRCGTQPVGCGIARRFRQTQAARGTST